MSGLPQQHFSFTALLVQDLEMAVSTTLCLGVWKDGCLSHGCRRLHMTVCLCVCTYPLPSNRHHWSSGDCLEGKGENYQVCSVQYCVQQLCTVQCTHVLTDLTGLWIGFCLTGPISLCLDSFLCMYVNVCIFCMTVYCMNV